MLPAKGVFPSTNLVKFHVSKVRNFALSWPFLLPKSYNVSAKKEQKSYTSWYWRPMQSLLKKLTCGFKYDMSNLVSFHATTQKFENFFLMGSFCPKYIRFELWKYIGVIFHDTEQWCKIWINPDLVASKMAWGTEWNFNRVAKSLENFYCDGLFLSKAYNVSARKVYSNYVSWHWK